MRNSFKALQAIEVLVGNDFGMDMEWLLCKNKNKKIDPQLIMAAKTITRIYRIAHAEISDCQHPDWEKEKYEILKMAEEHNLI